ncbi:MAG: DUF1330 domain-containing protein [Saprospiraceae bacterium]|nr:DUF1330 domain-containing protein [Saprospiraceae bacterium]
MKIIILQLIYIKKGEESTFFAFEDLAIPLITRYNGRLLLRLRPTENDFIEVYIEKPFEVHLVEFYTDSDFQNFLNDETRQEFLHLKEQSIRNAILIKGTIL